MSEARYADVTFAVTTYAYLSILIDFNHFVAIDWSSRAKPSPRKPSRNAIWVAEASAKGKVVTHYFRTRAACTDFLEERLLSLHRKGRRVLVGWDFSFGYPKGLAKALKIKPRRSAWLKIWELLDVLISDADNNHNNRFSVGGQLNHRIGSGSGPFWGVPIGQSGIFLGSRKDFSYPVTSRRVFLPERRLVEVRMPRLQPAWKLAYAGSVGSQALLGIPRVLYLAKKVPGLEAISRIWPFETDFAEKIPMTGALVLHAEIYPSMLSLPGKDQIPDREQVQHYVRFLQTEQRKAGLLDLLTEPPELNRKARKQILRHEGWVLGIK